MSTLFGVLGFAEFYLSEVIIGIVPKATVVVLLLHALAGAGLYLWLRISVRNWLAFEPPVLWLLAFATLAGVSSTWSADASASLLKGALLAAFVLATLLAVCLAKHTPLWLLAACMNGFILGTVTMIVLIAVELLSDQALSRAIFTWFPSLQETPNKHVFIAENVVVAVSEASSNRRVLIATLMLWPLVFTLWHIPAGFRRTLLIVTTALSYLVIFVVTKHQSSQVAVLLSAIAFSATLMSPSRTRIVLAVVWSMAILLVVPAVQLLHNAQWQNASWLFQSARERVVIWQMTAEGVMRRPLLGIGAAATKKYGASTPTIDAGPSASDGKTEVRNTRVHAHNAYLQTWYELGAVGAAIMLGIGLSLIHALTRLPSQFQPIAAAQFAAVAGMIAFSFGMWQEWFISAVGLSFVALSMAEALRFRQAPST